MVRGPGERAGGRCGIEDPAEGRCGWAVGLEVWWSFWGEEARQGVLLVASGLAGRLAGKFGQGARIGDECLDLCGEILAETSI
jgi:hypothetical protein